MTVSDGNGGFATQTLSITVVGRNDAPVATDDTQRMGEDRDTISGMVLRNDRDVDRDPLQVAEVNGDSLGVGAAVRGAYGTLTLQADGRYVYDLENSMAVVQGLRAGQTLTETFSYAISDPSGATATATLAITIVGRNDRPLLVADSAVATGGGGPVTGALLANDSDPEGDQLSVISIRRGQDVFAPGDVFAGTFGSLTVEADGSYRYDLKETSLLYDRLAAGDTRTGTFHVTVSDGNGGFATQTLSITVVGRNDAPVAADDTQGMSEDQGTISGMVLRNDRDVDRDPLQVAEVNGDSLGVGAAVRGAYGTLTLQADGRYVYDLENSMAAVQGLDTGETLTETFAYTVADPSGATDTATLTITVTGRNDRPVAAADNFNVVAGRSTVLDVLANDRDVDGDLLTVASVGRARNGTVSVDADGNLVYTPRAGFVGTDSFVYRPFDGDVLGAAVRVTVTVSANTAPVATDDSFTLRPGQVLDLPPALGLLSNDSDPDGDALSVTTITLGSQAGSLEAFTDGSFTYTPRAGFIGIETFGYTISDGLGGSDTGTITFNVENAAPIAVDDSFIMRPGQVLDLPPDLGLLSNDSDPDGDALSVTTITLGSQAGSLVAFTDGSFTYTPRAGFIGTETFSYTISDGLGGSDTGTITFNVENDLPPPVFAITAQSAASVIEGSDPDVGGAVTFTVTRLSGDLGAAEVIYQVGSGTPSPAGIADLANGVGTYPLTFAEGQMTATFTVTVNPDLAFEPGETVRVELASTDYGSVDGAFFQFTIENDDTPPEIAFAAADVGSTPEGNAGVEGRLAFTLTRSGDQTAPSTVLIEIKGDVGADDIRVSGATFQAAGGPGSVGFYLVQIPAFADTALIEVFATPDALPEPSETVIVEIVSVTENGTVSPTGAVVASGIFQNDDATPADLSLSLTLDTPETDIPLGTDVDLLVRVTNNGPATAGGSVRLTLGDGVTFGSAPQGFNPATGIWTFGPIGDQGFAELTLNTIFGTAGTPFITGEILTATAPDPDSTAGNGTVNGEDDTDGVVITVSPRADLSVTGPVGTINGLQGGTGTVTFIVTNSGPNAGGGLFGLAGTVLPLAASAPIVTGGSVDAAGVWTLPQLASGDFATITYTFNLNQVGAFSVAGEILAADQPDPDSTPGNFNTEPTPEDDAAIANLSIAPAADLSLSASVPNTTVLFGEEREILYSVSNAGPIAGGATVRFSDGPGGVVGDGPDGLGFIWNTPVIQPGAQAFLNLGVVFGDIGPRTITAEIETATQPDPDSTPGNFATQPAEDDGVAIDFTMPTSWRVTRIRDAVEGSDPTLDIATNVFRIERFATDLPETIINYTLRPGSGPNPVSANDVVGLSIPLQC